jgi:RNA polymerase sigma-70 factor (ECF subfamily)
MNARSTSATERERELLEAARRGNDDAFRRLVEPHRKELHAHCYRMLGSVHDADDALQDALLRAWRGLAKFEGRSSIRSWLYTITTNSCLDLISRRPKRVLPIDHGPAADPGDDLGEPLIESVWVEPYPADMLGVEEEEGPYSPEARYELRESVELAFIVALQHLPGTQRAVLILRDVLGFSAREAAETLETTVASVNGALRRARKAAAERLPGQSQQVALRALGDDGLRRLVERYIDAWEQGDVDAILAMLAEEATFTMPPLPTWYRGHDAIALFLTRFALRDQWRLVPARANGQLAFGCYAWDAEAGSHTALSLDVLTLEGTRASEVTSFVTPYTRGPARERFAAQVFERFGLPDRLD